MKETRSASQIIYGFLPEQTIDIRRGIWKVQYWRTAKRLNEVDAVALREEVLRQARTWEIQGADYGGFLKKLRAGAEIEPYGIDDQNGVQVTPFPKQWLCIGCRRLHVSPENVCSCGHGGKAQLHIVAFHDCGELREVHIGRCPRHGEVRVELGASASITDVRFQCPKCDWRQVGIPYMACTCGEAMRFNVHRAAVVYTPRMVVLVNPPLSNARRQLENAGGPARALSWFLGGMTERTALDKAETQETLAAELISKGLDRSVVERMIAASGLPKGDGEAPDLPLRLRAACETQAMKLALATLESRLQFKDLAAGTPEGHELREHYASRYPQAIRSAGLASIELIERFPIFTGHFGYTRGEHAPGASTLRPFPSYDRRIRRNAYPVYGDLAKTEALLVKLDPLRVADWLRARGYRIADGSSTRDALLAILNRAASQENGEEVQKDLLTLVHSYSHRFIRAVAVYAGIDRNALSEIVLDHTLSFIVYAVPRGDFVLGGLHAVFERELDSLLSEMVLGEHRCPLDPGCSKGSSACMACLHLGEPSCRLFNTALSRKVLFGKGGYFA